MKKELTTAIKGLKQRKGFAVMTMEDRTRIARMGGKALRKKYGRTHFVLIGIAGGKNSHKGNGK